MTDIKQVVTAIQERRYKLAELQHELEALILVRDILISPEETVLVPATDEDLRAAFAGTSQIKEK